MRMYEADLTACQLASWIRAQSLPRGKAEERMMQVMTREIPGSKYRVHRPSQLRISGHLLTRTADLQPDDKTSCDDTNVSEAGRLV